MEAVREAERGNNNVQEIQCKRQGHACRGGARAQAHMMKVNCTFKVKDLEGWLGKTRA